MSSFPTWGDEACAYCGHKTQTTKQHYKLRCPVCSRDGCPECMPAGRGCRCPECERADAVPENME